jgi:hypothetical protein
MLIAVYSKYLTHPEPALKPRYSCNIAILPYRSLTAIFDAAILFTAYIHTPYMLIRRSLRLSLPLAYRSSPHRNALHVAPTSLIAPISRRQFWHLVRRGGLAKHSVVADPIPHQLATHPRASRPEVPAQARLSAGRSCQHAGPPAERRASGIPLNYCGTEVAKTTLENPSDQQTGSSKSRPVSGLWLANNSSSDRE